MVGCFAGSSILCDRLIDDHTRQQDAVNWPLLLLRSVQPFGECGDLVCRDRADIWRTLPSFEPGRRYDPRVKKQLPFTNLCNPSDSALKPTANLPACAINPDTWTNCEPRVGLDCLTARTRLFFNTRLPAPSRRCHSDKVASLGALPRPRGYGSRGCDRRSLAARGRLII
jgi:hypothetical protein